jgi:beta-lactamase regulating signal transducer with metallopeptidase domain
MLSILQTNLPLVVGIWVLGCAILFSRLILGYLWVNSLKNSPKNQFDEKLTMVLETLKLKMNITKSVQVKVSSMVSLPMIMGVLKPVILIPACLVSGFSQQQLETILAHELAHLKRHDFLLNGLQSVLDVIYFFHPAMWLLSAQIRKERENCCDDMALEVSGSKLLLAKTLVQLQETTYTPKLAMAFGKKSYSLLERVQRIVGISSPRNFNKESIWIVVGLFVTFFAFAQKKAEKVEAIKLEKSEGLSETYSESDTLRNSKKSQGQIVIQSDEYDFRIKDKKIYLDGKEVVLSPEVQAQVNARIDAMEANQQQMEAQSLLMEEQSKKMEMVSAQMEANTKPMEEIGQKMEEIGKKMEEASKKYTAELNQKKLGDKDLEAFSKKFERQMDEYGAQMDVYGKQMDEYAKEMDKSSQPLDALSSKLDELAAPLDALSEELDKNVEAIIALLPLEIKNKIAKDRPNPPSPPRVPKAPKSVAAPKSPKSPLSPKSKVSPRSATATESLPKPPNPPKPPLPVKD